MPVLRLAVPSHDEMNVLYRSRPVLQDISSGSPILHRNIDYEGNVTPNAMYEPSPDEEIIKARSLSHRHGLLQPLTLCFDQLNHDGYETGDFLRMTPMKDEDLLELPRKRLRLSSVSTDTNSLSLSPTSSVDSPLQSTRFSTSSIPRSSRTRNCRQAFDTPFHSHLHSYTTSQLASVLDKIVRDHPELETEVRNLLPLPDLTEFIDRLTFLRRAISRSFPTVRWDSIRDSFCFRRVKVHLQVFRTTCYEQLKQLIYSESWETVIRYVVLAWTCVETLPNWENACHNKIKKSCFTLLAYHCMQALKLRVWERNELIDIRQKLLACERLSLDISPCVRYINRLLDTDIAK